MSATGRASFPSLNLLLEEANELLCREGLPVCERLEPVADGDTANPNAKGFADGREYAVKVCYRHPTLLIRQRKIANEIRQRTSLPIPEHLCCSNDDSPHPLMIMEWMPGLQLRVILREHANDNLNSLFRSLGQCLGTFHDPALLPLVDQEYRPTGAAEWWRRRIEQVLDSSASEGLRREIPRADIEQYHWRRLRAIREATALSLVKADQDSRDFLVDPEENTISAMLDWERVEHGDAMNEVAVFYLRMTLHNRMDSWPAFREGYESTGRKIVLSPQFEFLLFNRAILASRHNPAANGLIRDMLEGKQPRV